MSDSREALVTETQVRKRSRVMSIIRWLIKRLVNLQVIGAENIPKEGPCMVVISHISRLDPPFLMASTERSDLVAVVAHEYRSAPLIGWIMNALHVIWITRGENDMQAFRKVLEYLKAGWIVGIAPEGTRSKDEKLLEGKHGAAVLADRAGVMLLPIALSGSNKMVQSFSHLRKIDAQVVIGEPFALPPHGSEDSHQWLNMATDEIMCQIAALLPPERHGFYAGHPRLAELLALKGQTQKGS